MRLGRLEIGVSKFEPGFKPRFAFSHDKGACGCHIFDFHALYLTWLGDECYASSRVSEQEGGSQEVGSPSSSDRSPEKAQLQDSNAQNGNGQSSNRQGKVSLRKMRRNKWSKRNSRRPYRPSNKR